MATNTSDNDISDLLSRLSSKVSVQSLLVLSRETGAIIRTSGFISRSADAVAQEYAATIFRHVKASVGLVAQLEDIDEGLGSLAPDAKRDERAEKDEDDRDDVRLLRIRTKRRELVVVPDAKFILVVFHDTSPAP